MKQEPVRLLSAALLAACVLLACIPNEATGPWSVFPGAVHENGSGVDPGVLVVGDSLLFQVPQLDQVNNLRFWTGLSAYAASAGGMSTSHFRKASLAAAASLDILEVYVDLYAPRITVIALGTNDARILSVQDTIYEFPDYVQSLNKLLDHGLRNNGCAIVVNVSENWEPQIIPHIVQINDQIITTTSNRGPRARVADWNSYSAGQPWFAASDDVHHNAAGKVEYMRFITGEVQAALNDGC